jgi:stage II sporulation protein D
MRARRPQHRPFLPTDAMPRLASPTARRRRWSNGLAGVLLLAVALTSGCNTSPLRPADFSGRTPVVRVLLLSNRSHVTVTADLPPIAKLMGDPDTHRVDLSPGTPVTLTLTAQGWQLGAATIKRAGELTILPAVEGSVRVDGHAYRGRFRFVPRASPALGTPTFDVVNDVDVENYLRGVVARELPPDFAPAAYAAQTVVARTYALYTMKSAGAAARFDLYADERSQVYGGLSGESPKALDAVDATTGEVVAYGPAGRERIFKAYYSSCCGGRGQSAADAFGDPPIAPLAAQACGSMCAGSPWYNWPPVVVSKAELTRRIRHWGQIHSRPERGLATVRRIEVAAENLIGRPVRFVVSDVNGRRFTLTGEEIRTAVNTDAPPKLRLPSSLFRPDDRGDAVAFDDGHGRGHGVGMCQYCAQARAQRGADYRQIVLAAYPSAVILRAY